MPASLPDSTPQPLSLITVALARWVALAESVLFEKPCLSKQLDPQSVSTSEEHSCAMWPWVQGTVIEKAGFCECSRSAHCVIPQCSWNGTLVKLATPVQPKSVCSVTQFVAQHEIRPASNWDQLRVRQAVNWKSVCRWFDSTSGHQ